MATVLGLITRCLKDAGVIGVGQTASAEDANDAFDKLNAMLGQFSLRRWLMYQLVDTAFTSTGAQSYSIGPGCNFNVPRPDRIEAAFCRQLSSPQTVDWPLGIIEAHEDYNRIALKTLGSLPGSVFYDSGYPTGTLYFWPVPTAGMYELHVLTKLPLTAFTSLTQTIVLPPEYEEALVYNLAIRLRPAYQMAPDPTITQLAKAALNTIKNANVQMPRLQMPVGLSGRYGGWSGGALGGAYGGTMAANTYIATNLNGSGTTQDTATPISVANNVASGGVIGGGFILPASTAAGLVVTFTNYWSGDQLVYPPDGAQINTFGVNVPVLVAPGDTVSFSTSAPISQWYRT